MARCPLSKAKFVVEIAGLEGLGGWVRLSGIGFTARATPRVSTPDHLPGKRSPWPLTLVRQFDDDPRLSEWASKGAGELRNGAIIFLDFTGQELRRFNFEGAYASAYDLKKLDADDSSERAFEETIVLTVENFHPG